MSKKQTNKKCFTRESCLQALRELSEAYPNKYITRTFVAANTIMTGSEWKEFFPDFSAFKDAANVNNGKQRTKTDYEKTMREEITDEEIQQTFLVPEKFKTTEDMITYCQIDTHIWEPFKIVSNFWGSTNNPNWQYKVWWRRKEKEEVNPEVIDWNYILSDLEPLKITVPTLPKLGHFDRLVITDAHIGMSTNKYGESLYGGVWNKKELFFRMQEIVAHCAAYQGSNILYIDDLGDLLDGYDAKTVRQGHSLPQNMSNKQSFDAGLRFKRVLTELLLDFYDEIVWHNVCNDNHSGDWGYAANSAIKEMLERLYPERVTVNNVEKFIEHYQVGKNIIVLSHGKDKDNLKFSFPVFLNTSGGKTAITKISDYLDYHHLKGKDVHIEFAKGDSHQQATDETSNQHFDYENYRALSPASAWVQTNFKRGNSGFTFYNYPDEKRPWLKLKSTFRFDWKAD